MNRYTLAHHLGIPISQVMEMPVEDYLGHWAYLEICMEAKPKLGRRRHR